MTNPKEPTEAIGVIADFLTDQRDEPWPDGTAEKRLHYWRDKAINAATHLRAMIAASPPDQGRVEKLEAALERLGSSETMTTSFLRRNNAEGRELLARMTFARAALTNKDTA